MRLLIKKIFSNNIIRNSSILFSGSGICAIGNYLYHLILARMLSVSAYGELESLIALFYIISVPAGTILLVMTKYAAKYKAEGNPEKIYTLFIAFTKKLLLVSIIFFIIFAFLSGFIARFLKLDDYLPVLIVGISLIAALLVASGRGILNGLQKFFSTSINMIIEVVAKVVLSIILVYFSFGINGAVGAVTLSGLISYFAIFKPIKFIFKNKNRVPIEYRAILRYSVPVFISTLFLICLYNVDVLLVKHFFSPELAGRYGALVVLARIIFFVTMTISTVIFPMAAEAHSKNGDHKKILKQGFFLVSLVAGLALVFYFSVPGLIIKILIGAKFLDIKAYLGWFGLVMFLYSLIHLMVQYFLSINKIKCFYLLGLGIVLQIVAINFWHNTLREVVVIMTITMFFVLLLLLGYYWMISKKSG